MDEDKKQADAKKSKRGAAGPAGPSGSAGAPGASTTPAEQKKE
jgi:hypothetical protein